jgi:hypothetical protein
MEKSTNSGTAFDRIGGYFQRFRRGVENCKTFMRRFDPDPRLQIINNLEALQSGGFFLCSGYCSGWLLFVPQATRRAFGFLDGLA